MVENLYLLQYFRSFLRNKTILTLVSLRPASFKADLKSSAPSQPDLSMSYCLNAISNSVWWERTNFTNSFTILVAVWKWDGISLLSTNRQTPQALSSIMQLEVTNKLIKKTDIYNFHTFRSTPQPFYNTICYNTVLDITWFKNGTQKCINYIEKWS